MSTKALVRTQMMQVPCQVAETFVQQHPGHSSALV